MPHGLIVMQWNEKSGIEIKSKYPENKDFNLTKETLLQIYNMHQYSQEPGIAYLNNESINFITYYSGSEENIFIALILTVLENAEDYEVIFKEASLGILENLEDKRYRPMLPGFFEQISIHSKLI